MEMRKKIIVSIMVIFIIGCGTIFIMQNNSVPIMNISSPTNESDVTTVTESPVTNTADTEKVTSQTPTTVSNPDATATVDTPVVDNVKHTYIIKCTNCGATVGPSDSTADYFNGRYACSCGKDDCWITAETG